MSFAKTLKYLRENKELTQEQLADKLSVSKSAISMYERGNRVPDLETLELIADFFNVDLNFLTGNKNNTEEYYLDLETKQIAQEIFENKELRMLFDATRNVKKEDLKLVYEMVKRMKTED